MLLASAILPPTSPVLGAPSFERLVISSHEKIGSNCFPCLARLDDGRHMVVWSATLGKGYCVVGAFSRDHGKTWTEPVTLIATEEGRDYDPSITVSGERVFVTSTTVPAGVGIRTSTTWCTRSDDNGATWSKLYEIPMNRRYTCGKTAHGIRLRSGVLLMGYSWDVLCEQGKTLQTEGQMHLRAGVMRSTDNGDTWHNGGDTDAAYQKVSGGAVHGTDEPSIVELGDGSVYMLMRTGSTSLYEARSHDEGKTWSDIGPSPLRGTNAPCALCKFQVGDRRGILCVWDNAVTRYPLCAAASFDGGRTWTWPKDIAGPTGGRQASYPGCEQADDGTLVAVWQQDVEVGRDLRCARFNLDWLLEDPTLELKEAIANVRLPTDLGKATSFTGSEIARSSTWQIHRPGGKPLGGEVAENGILRMVVNGCYHIDNMPDAWDGATSKLVEFRMRVIGHEQASGSHAAAEVWIGGPRAETGCQLFLREDAVAFEAGYLLPHQVDTTEFHTYRVWTDLTAKRAYLFLDENRTPVLATHLGSPESLDLNRILIGDSSAALDVAGTSEWDYVSWRDVEGK